MKLKKRSKQVIAWLMMFVLCMLPVAPAGSVAQAEEADAGEESVVLQGPVIDAEDAIGKNGIGRIAGRIIWDCIYFGNYWQSEYQPENEPEEGEDGEVYTDTDGTKYFVREGEDNKMYYKYEPIKWRVLSVSEDGKDAFLMADKNLDSQPYHTAYDKDVTWETSFLREWLNESFLETAFTQEEQDAIALTDVENKRNSYYEGDDADAEEEDNPTKDKVYLLSVDEAVTRAYGFDDKFNSADGGYEGGFSGTETRKAKNTDFAESGGTDKAVIVFDGYLLRTLGAVKGYVLNTGWKDGDIPTTQYANEATKVNDREYAIRPVLHLDLTKTDLWTYAGKVRQDQLEISPDATPAAPIEVPTEKPGVTMAPGQTYPKNPVVDDEDLEKNKWDCIYFGKYYNTKITPPVLSPAGDHGAVMTDENGKLYVVLHELGYFWYEPIKWRVLSINEDGTDAFLMADQAVDVAPYHSGSSLKITWEDSDIRQWLQKDFLETAFTEEEKGIILDSQVHTEANMWSEEPGGNDTTDKIYLLSIEEALEPTYGFSSDKDESSTRRIIPSDYADAEESLQWVYPGYWPHRNPKDYWLRSSGIREGYPAEVGDYYGGGKISTTISNTNKSSDWLGVRPVMHVDLSDTTLWTYAGQVTPKGVVASEDGDPTISPSEEPTQKPDVTDQSEEPTQKPDATVQPPAQTQNPQSTQEPEVKKPGKPAIKKLKSKSGKKVTVTLSKDISGAAGYQVAYAAKSSMKGQKQKSFQGTSVTISGLKKKTYYFRVRAYAKIDGRDVYGKWSNIKSIKVKK